MSDRPKKVPDQPRKLEIDQGFRAWYESCPCCLSESYPQIKHALDEEEVLRAAEKVARE